ncbi:unnamed protein product [Trichogramma brassicae]|uniref:Uncharacterized protein n=1 Tax=Trichogramma brassicae TaxID=86971 RepID=A0A6H5J8C0_9HYME|nr:unnamed protein product [Trichogramma brassicae]
MLWLLCSLVSYSVHQVEYRTRRHLFPPRKSRCFGTLLPGCTDSVHQVVNSSDPISTFLGESRRSGRLHMFPGCRTPGAQGVNIEPADDFRRKVVDGSIFIPGDLTIPQAMSPDRPDDDLHEATTHVDDHCRGESLTLFLAYARYLGSLNRSWTPVARCVARGRIVPASMRLRESDTTHTHAHIYTQMLQSAIGEWSTLGLTSTTVKVRYCMCIYTYAQQVYIHTSAAFTRARRAAAAAAAAASRATRS